MKRLLLGATSFLALVALDFAAKATPFDFTYTGSLVTFTVPTTDTYQTSLLARREATSRMRGQEEVWEPRSVATLDSPPAKFCRSPSAAKARPAF
jgi:hypothetical protein